MASRSLELTPQTYPSNPSSLLCILDMSNPSKKRKAELPKVQRFKVKQPGTTTFTHTTDPDSSSSKRVHTTIVNPPLPPFPSVSITSSVAEDIAMDAVNEKPGGTLVNIWQVLFYYLFLYSEKNLPLFQTHSQLMDDMMKYKDIFLEEIMNLEWSPDVEKKCRCGKDTAMFRCNECLNGIVLCSACTMAAHQANPFHWITRWNGKFFKRITLHSLGHRVCLGHNGVACPTSGTSDVKTVTIVHLNGIQRVSFLFCSCLQRSAARQLMQARLFPATTENPATAFTFTLLKQFQKHSSESGQPAYVYFMALRRFTDDLGKDDVTDRYREFLRIMRIWEHLQSEKFAGHTHNIGQYLPTALQDNLAVLCAACPQPEINLPYNWKDTERDKVHIHTLFLDVDGNFSLEERDKKKRDHSDMPLDDGRGFFVSDRPYMDYRKQTAADLQVDAEASTCSGFKAVMRPQGVVNLQKGERFCNVDYALAKAIRDTVEESSHLRIVLSYDVGCQYEKKLKQRMAKWFPEIIPLLQNFVVVVPKMHIKAHKPECFQLYSFDYTSYVGQTDGEGGERIWRETNQYAGSTREMQHGGHQDKINCYINDWNWRKIERMDTHLVDKRILAQTSREKYQEEFEDLSLLAGETLTEQWKLSYKKPQKLSDGSILTPFEPDPVLLPTQADLLIPQLASTLKDLWKDIENDEYPEEIVLPLPSTLSEAEREEFNMGHISTIEWRLREGQALDALKQLKDAIIQKLGYVQARKEQVRGIRAATRAATIINNQQVIVEKYAELYRQAREAMLQLGMPQSDPRLCIQLNGTMKIQ
ncbi:hypothetical protein M422DRAFT_47974 [Sphaerobolus stellatus SS14]|uniref:Unplaced genomic scaffold SPHSTscaffold_50, whole genome shotgun sequence n=1 Tax=Sphaerobolus stellatus (strain SS14) TaxID=990650 RepID=A0A0C9VML4_SPHS4|nr:hypothetical protein M422DRAFT_47974 [Sphaerobolus stellatus SS14]